MLFANGRIMFPAYKVDILWKIMFLIKLLSMTLSVLFLFKMCVD